MSGESANPATPKPVIDPTLPSEDMKIILREMLPPAIRTEMRRKAVRLFSVGSFDLAMVLFRGLVSSDPDNYNDVIGLASSAFSLKRIDEAYHHARRLEELDADRRDGQLLLGQCLEELGRPLEAEEIFRAIVELPLATKVDPLYKKLAEVGLLRIVASRKPKRPRPSQKYAGGFKLGEHK